MSRSLEILQSFLAGNAGDDEPSYYLLTFRGDTLASIDGAHSKPEGVTQARKLMTALGLHRGGETYVMLTVSAVPDMPVSINDELAAVVRASVERYQNE